ncbi:hypothetical protein CAPTEDRAFT_229145 [Capitella teleta]|uniref:Uncharacterized protein n=1 Tax=Capitella teleta TaxID=283909 RepID=R7V366_CAPTE|nr:hypothetical protein CAPTEDRAFT_229145 [Capitella teleta]|eukprot:ELU13283.1 hypothetical protein CAPTEDRAFT_229145 [Capitella teleta]
MIGSEPTTMALTTIVFACFLLTWANPSDAGFECKFPDFMQSDTRSGSKRDWRTHLMEGGRHHMTHNWEVAYGFYGDSMRASVLGGSKAKDAPMPFSRQCIIEVTEGRYLVEHQDQEVADPRLFGQTMKYLCIEFVRHSDDVVQILESELVSYTSPKLCSDNRMRINPWMIINRANFFSASVPCPLQGGFSTKIFDKMRNLDVCSAYEGSTRLESECMRGEGMFFRFRHDICVPEDLQMDKQQRVHCMATWQKERFTYSILRSDQSEQAWCFRFPTDNNGAFQSYLFRDLRCETEEIPESTDRYLRIAVVQDESRTLSDLCVDDYEACSYWNSPCIHAGSIMQLTCAKRCGICSPQIPTTCSLPAALKGKWKEKLPDATNHINLRDLHLDVDGLASFRCIQWYSRPYAHDATKYEQMFVTTFENGCRPRYTCAQFSKHSPSVLKYKLSQSEIWPWEGTTGVTVSCHPFKYKEDDMKLGSRFRSNYLKVFVADEENHAYVKCKLPHRHIQFTAVQRNQLSCQGELNSLSSNYFQVTYANCSSMPAQQKFACMDSSSHGYFGDHLVVTDVVNAEEQSHMCWLFSPDASSSFYLLELEFCHSAAKDHIVSGLLDPLVTFKPVLSTTTTMAPTTFRAAVENIVSVSHKLNESWTEDALRNAQGGYRIQSDQGKDNGQKLDEVAPAVVISNPESKNSVGCLHFNLLCALLLLMIAKL